MRITSAIVHPKLWNNGSQWKEQSATYSPGNLDGTCAGMYRLVRMCEEWCGQGANVYVRANIPPRSLRPRINKFLNNRTCAL